MMTNLSGRAKLLVSAKSALAVAMTLSIVSLRLAVSSLSMSEGATNSVYYSFIVAAPDIVVLSFALGGCRQLATQSTTGGLDNRQGYFRVPMKSFWPTTNLLILGVGSLALFITIFPTASSDQVGGTVAMALVLTSQCLIGLCMGIMIITCISELSEDFSPRELLQQMVTVCSSSSCGTITVAVILATLLSWSPAVAAGQNSLLLELFNFYTARAWLAAFLLIGSISSIWWQYEAANEQPRSHIHIQLSSNSPSSRHSAPGPPLDISSIDEINQSIEPKQAGRLEAKSPDNGIADVAGDWLVAHTPFHPWTASDSTVDRPARHDISRGEVHGEYKDAIGPCSPLSLQPPDLLSNGPSGERPSWWNLKDLGVFHGSGKHELQLPPAVNETNKSVRFRNFRLLDENGRSSDPADSNLGYTSGDHDVDVETFASIMKRWSGRGKHIIPCYNLPLLTYRCIRRPRR